MDAMRFAVALLAIAACDSDLDRLEDFRDKTDRVCAHSQTDVVPVDTVACMNDSLTQGGRAQVDTLSKDSRGFDVRTYIFTVDHEVHVFESYPNGTEGNEEPRASEQPTCAGPFRGTPSGSPAAVYLVVDGCP
jgi:hypothetical protein